MSTKTPINKGRIIRTELNQSRYGDDSPLPIEVGHGSHFVGFSIGDDAVSVTLDALAALHLGNALIEHARAVLLQMEERQS